MQDFLQYNFLMPPAAAAVVSIITIVFGYLQFKKRKDTEIAQAASMGVIEGTKVIQESHKELIEFFRKEVGVLRDENITLREKVRTINQHLDATLLKLNSIKSRLVVSSQLAEKASDDGRVLIHESVLKDQIKIIDEIIDVLQQTRPVA